MRIAPIIEILIRIDWIFSRFDGRFVMIRIMPYPPSFSKMAAKIIDPAIGASTWALGSHRWVENIGNFTRNPIINRRLIIWVEEGIVIEDVLMFIDIDHLYIIKNIRSMGKDAMIVYIIMYMLA